jgi:hypothetical protein
MLQDMRLPGLSGKQLPALGMLNIRIDGERRNSKFVDVTTVAAGETLVPSVMDTLDGRLRASGLLEYFSLCVTEVKIGSLGCYCW